jgi:ABC-type branched-subunit amino acid transport system ATPase component
MTGGSPILEMRGISKRFPGVQALSRVDFRLFPGEVHALMGQNGAGKSTLIKVLTGVSPADLGQILLEGKEIRPDSPVAAQALGISTVYQEVNLCPNLSAAENIFLGRSEAGTYRIRWKDMRRKAEEILLGLDVDVDVTAPLSEYSIAIQQMVAIARSLSMQARILILDEPTSSLAEHEVSMPLRALAMGLHLMNTFLLLASLAVTAAYASLTARPYAPLTPRPPLPRGERGRGNATVLWTIAAPLVLLVGAGATGAIAALGDTLFHASSLAQGMRDDGLATAHLFVRLRALHPLLAGLAAVAVLASASVVTALRSSPAVVRAALVVRIAIVAQVLAGIVNLVLLAPVGMQIVHLVLADAVWIAVVLLGARAMEGDAGVERSGVVGVPAE